MNAVIFDFNGTLFDDTKQQIEAWNRFYLEVKGEIPDAETFKNVIIGSDNRTIFKKTIDPEISDADVKRYTEKKERYYLDACLESAVSLKLIKGAEVFFETLDKLNVPFAIATGSPLINVDFYMKHIDCLKRWFALDVNLVYDDFNIKGKPAPDIYLKTAKKLNVKPESCTIFEDSLPGYFSARAAGAKSIIMIEKKENFGKFETLEGVSAVLENYLDTDKLLSLCEIN